MSKKKDIISHSKGLFEQFGFKKTTLTDIAKATGYVKSAIYYYFTGKEEIFAELVRTEADEFVTSLIEKVNAYSGDDNLIAVYVNIRFRSLQKLASRYRYIKNEFMELYEVVEINRQDALNREIEFVETLIAKTYPADSADSVKFKAILLVNLLKGFEVQVYITERTPLESIDQKLLIDFIINGISSQTFSSAEL